MALNISAAKRGFLYNPASKSLGIYVDGVKVEDYATTAGRTYYVNNITGSSTADGLSWGSACDEISTAIALVVARQATMDTGDEYVRNRIIVQATSTGYANLTSLAGYTDYIGIGADPSGNGVGIARIDGAGAADSVDTGSATVRGPNFYNLQFTHSATPGTTYYCFDIAGAMYRARFEHCGFTNGGAACFHAKSCGSIVMDDCQTKQDQFNALYGMLIGSTSASTGNFNNCQIKNSYFHGTTAGVLVYNNSCNDTLFDHCTFVGGVNGFVDLDNDANGAAHRLFLVDCYGYGTDSTTRNAGGFEVTNASTTKGVGCIGNDGGTIHMWPATTTA